MIQTRRNSLFIGLYILRFPSLFAQHFATSLQILQLNCGDPDPTPKHIPIPITKKTTHNSKFARFLEKLVCSNKKEKSRYVILNVILFRAKENTAYLLDVGSTKVPVYCHMTKHGLDTCGGGGWTLVMKINGSKVLKVNCSKAD